MPRLRYFGYDHISDPAAKLGSNIRRHSFLGHLEPTVAHAAALERLEFDRGAESTMNKRGFRSFPTCDLPSTFPLQGFTIQNTDMASPISQGSEINLPEAHLGADDY